MIIRNVFYLQFIKAIELLIPLIAIPIVIKYLGISNYGIIALLQAISAYIILIGEWGYNANATREFSSDISTFEKALLYIEIQKVKFLFCILIFICLILLKFIIEITYLQIFILFVWVCTSILQCKWYFQATYKLINLVIISLLSKIIYVIYVFLFVNYDTKIEEYLLFLILPNIILFIYSNFYIIKKLPTNKIKNKKYFSLSTKSKLLLKEGWHLTSMRLITGAINPIALIIAKSIYGIEFVGFIGVAQRIVSASVSILTPIIDVTFPKMNYFYLNNKNKFYKFINIILLFFIFIQVLGIFIYTILDQYIFYILNINYSEESALILFFYLIIIFFSLANSFLVHMLVIMKRSKYISPFSLLSGTITISFMLLIEYFYHSQYNFVFSILLGQFFLFISILYLKGKSNIS
ncbi:oligosaccharide flippase family protein [Proteus mirabilis]|uniref:oligosaccharide flippase family protein n=1 Tax=Proteus mirabilis TaxID=584 RepID=UPI00234B185B|nr:oligosaccharide flippase family protein [Proteus mirabilis]MDC5896685.1 oligosaccharide flippase family protein [Proteus mirabilis]MDC5900163.1 oligosaccharide flippase family protein [Proteus mirabilis]MDC5917819.1 oligosaccharide flippase family protein [Proteus mirabilis]MDC5928337.1 oligosaccharide flippase family protein [Proteus mirabilis]MDC5935375.1 oligosaccharide flippase family protein [Proteus mirabilis]